MATKKKPEKVAEEQRTLFPEPVDFGRVRALAQELSAVVAAVPMPARVEALNEARTILATASPFAAEPVDCVLWIPEERVSRNEWNPNAVAEVEMTALVHSVEKYGFTMPIVGSRLHDGSVGINDGFHRKQVPPRSAVVRIRCHGFLPVSILPGTMTDADRMSATLLMNQARGRHAIEKELPIVANLAAAGWTDDQIAVGTVKSHEELVRIGQLAGGGAAKNLAAARFAKAWTFEKPETTEEPDGAEAAPAPTKPQRKGRKKAAAGTT